jgi:alkylhydroperoxidase family enzyme
VRWRLPTTFATRAQQRTWHGTRSTTTAEPSSTPAHGALWLRAEADADAVDGRLRGRRHTLRAHGLDDATIHDAIQVISYFNYINRITEGVGADG